MATSSGVKRSWQRVDGVLLLDKATGITSNSALQGARRLFSAAKAGHTGTLDPLATGLLPLCFGEATKFSADLLDADKTYEADVLFGVTTDTGDADGVVIRQCRPAFGISDLEAAMGGFRGAITQVPPMYSALKVDGKPLYRLARQGIEIERTPRQVSILELQLLDFAGERCRFHISCSKGTYIRTLMEDIGNALGCGAHLTALRRVRVGALSIAKAFTLDQLLALPETERAICLLPPDALLQSLPAVYLDESASLRFCHGNPVQIGVDGVLGKCRVYDTNRLLGVGEADVSGSVKPKRLVCV